MKTILLILHLGLFSFWASAQNNNLSIANSKMQVISKIFSNLSKKPDNYSGPFDTTKSFFLVNLYYDFSSEGWTKMKGTIVKKLTYSNDSIKIVAVSKSELLFNITIIEPSGRIKEEGMLKGIGPYSITQSCTQNSGISQFEYRFNYYLVKIGEWKKYEDNSVKKTVYSTSKEVDITKLSKTDYEAFKKRRKSFISKNKLPKDYYE